MANQQQKRKHYFVPRHKLEDLLTNLGIQIVTDTGTDIIAFCPFHSNHDSPAFNISLQGPHLWKCHNARCGEKGNIISLLMKKGYSFSESEKMVLKGYSDVNDLYDAIENILADKKKDRSDEWVGVDIATFAEADAECGYPAQEYLSGRGITQEAYDFFRMGYSMNKRMMIIPVFSDRGKLSGVIGRSIKDKRYQYSNGLSRGELVWNLNNAKHYDSIILTEGALDAVYVWQAGFKNVGAVFGSSISARQWELIRSYFSEVICMFDNDAAGEALTREICENVRGLEISFVKYPRRLVGYYDEDGVTQTRPVKDPGCLTPREIQYMVEYRKTNLDVLLSDQK